MAAMTSDATLATARTILTELQSAVDGRDLNVLAGLFHDDAILIGTSMYNVGREAVHAYLTVIVEQSAALRWDWSRVVVFHEGDGELGIGGFGEIVVTEDGDEQRAPFRLTVLAVQTIDGWRLKQFHGSIPSDS